MTQEEFIAKLADKWDVEVTEIQPDSPVGTVMEWDSMAILAFLMMADKHLGVNPPPEKVLSVETFGDLYSIVRDGFSN